MTSSPELLQRAEALFHRLLPLDATARERALAGECAGDAGLADEVRSLLTHADELAGFLEEPALGTDFTLLPATALDEADPDELVGRRVGPYRIEARIASGGMGTVYLAVRDDDQFTQQVAIKIVKRGMDSEEILRRFRRERQTLAALAHPNIARLLDGGVTDGGQPYLVMEHVSGEPIDVFCDRRRLGVRERVELLITICDAVDHAHQNLVVHRDLKPGNILVTPKGVPKLLDFGIATVVDPDDPTRATSPGERRLTPEYASPEQVAGRVVATTSDVYSLGVILYELLTGRPPYRFPERTPADIERVVSSVEPPAPSEAIGGPALGNRPRGQAPSPAAPQAVARARGTTPAQLRRRLRGDLDVIALTALRKEPGRRYASVERLAADLRRHLRGLPVVARRDTVGYRVTRFVRRHVVGTALSGVALALLVTGAIVFAWQARVAERQRDEAFVARDQATATTAFLQEMLASADPAERGPDVTVHEVLGDAARRIDTSLRDQPLVQADLRDTIGRTYLSLGLLDEAELHLRKAYAQRVALLGPGHIDVAESMTSLATLDYDRGALDEAADLLEGALRIQRTERGQRNPDVARTLSSLGAVQRARGRLAEAEDLQRKALAIRREVTGADSLDTAESLNNLAGVLAARGDLREAREALEQSLDIRRRQLGEHHPLVAQAIDNLGVLLCRQRDFVEAEPLFRQALSVELGLLGEDHPDVAVTRRNLGMLLLSRGEPQEAITLLRRALQTRIALYAASDARLITTRLDLAGALAAQGAWDEAEPLIVAAVAGALDPASPPEVRVFALERAAGLYEQHGSRADAERLRALAGDA